MVGSNADVSMAKKYKGMTRPDGDYYYTTKAPKREPWNNLKKQRDSSYNSSSYKNILRGITDDSNIPKGIREIINDDYYYSHSAEKKVFDIQEGHGEQDVILLMDKRSKINI